MVVFFLNICIFIHMEYIFVYMVCCTMETLNIGSKYQKELQCLFFSITGKHLENI